MLGRLRQRVTFANVCAAIALFVALGTGGAYAANTIGSADVIDDSLLSADIHNGTLQARDLATNAIGSGPIADGSLTAVDIKDGTLTRGYAYVNAAGAGQPSFRSGQVRGFTAVTRGSQGNGYYCLAPPSGVDPSKEPAVAQVVQNTGFAGNPIDLYMTDAATAGCPANDYAVVTMAFVTGEVHPNPNLDFTIVLA